MTSVGDSSRRIYRWAFNCRQWEPLKEEIRLALAVVQSEEKNRILRFVVVGLLLLFCPSTISQIILLMLR